MEQLKQYLTHQIEDWQDKIDDLLTAEKRYQKRKDAAQKTVSYLKLKASTCVQMQKEYEKQILAAKRKLEEIGQKT